jgi:hypothetical protein
MSMPAAAAIAPASQVASMRLRRRRILRLIFQLSFKALSRNLVESDYDAWSERKGRIQRRLNMAVFRFASAAAFHRPALASHKNKQFLLDALQEVVTDHLKRRLSLYRFCAVFGRPNARIFLFAATIAMYCDVLKKALFATARNLKFRAFDVGSGSGAVVLAIGFPEHSFSVSLREGKLSAIPASFGDFFTARYPGATLISVDEYVRPSKSREDHETAQMDRRSKSLTRHKSERRWHAGVTIRRMCRMAWEIGALAPRLVRCRGAALFELMFYVYWARGFDYVRMAEELGKRLEAIFVLPLSSGLGMLPHLSATHEKLICYSYSQNYCEPPTTLLNQERHFNTSCDYRTALAEISPDGWRISGKAEGFTDIFEYVNSLKRFLRTRFSLELPVDGFSQPLQQPLLLGFETAGARLPERKARYIVIFDVPPEARHHQLSRHFCGNLSYDFSVVSDFLRELSQTCIECGFEVFLKPKYSLQNYAAEYGRLLRELLAAHPSHFHLLSPYGDARPVLESAAASVSMPFTSMKLLCDHVSLPSLYYLPERFRVAFSRDGGRPDIHFGRAQLAGTLTQLR